MVAFLVCYACVKKTIRSKGNQLYFKAKGAVSVRALSSESHAPPEVLPDTRGDALHTRLAGCTDGHLP